MVGGERQASERVKVVAPSDGAYVAAPDVRE